MTGVLTVATLNLRDFARVDLLEPLIGQVDVPVDVLFLQEATHATDAGQAPLFRAEDALSRGLHARFGDQTGRMRGLFTPSPLGPTGQVVFVRCPRVRVVAHWRPECQDAWHDQPGTVQARVDDGPTLTLRSLHLPYWSGNARLDAARRLTRYADTSSILAGDCNGLAPGDPNEPDFEVLAPRKRHHKSYRPAPDRPRIADRRALAELADAGFVCAAQLAGDWTPTVNDGIDCGAEAAIDHILLAPVLSAALLPDTYRVHVSEIGDRASDHRLVSVSLDLTRT